jgi:hypothetical protein
VFLARRFIAPRYERFEMCIIFKTNIDGTYIVESFKITKNILCITERKNARNFINCYLFRCVCFIYLIEFMSTTDLMDIVPSSENAVIDNEQEPLVDREKEEQTQQYQFDVIVIGSGPGGRYVY